MILSCIILNGILYWLVCSYTKFLCEFYQSQTITIRINSHNGLAILES